MNDDERAVLADELQLRGDPQGELIALQLALAALPDSVPRARRQLIERKIDAVLDRHHDVLYGALAPFVERLSRPDRIDPVLRVKRWDGGFADTVWIQRAIEGPDLVAALRALRALPLMRFVRRIEIGIGDHPAAVAELVRDPPPSLRELAIGGIVGSLGPVTSVHLRDTAPLEPLMPTLERLELAYRCEISAIVAARMRAVFLIAGDDADRVFDLEMPELERLRCYNFAFDRAFVDRYPKLRELVINTSRFEPDWFEHFVRSPMLARLESLAISIIREDALRLIAAERERFEHLTRLDLTNNYFSPAVRSEIATSLPACLRYR